MDCDQTKISRLQKGDCPIYEPGLEELLRRNISAGRLRFTTDLASAVGWAKVIFIAVGTPPRDDGSVDLAALWNVVDGMAPHLSPEAIVVIKSTAPVGTNAAVAARLRELTGRPVAVATNPEFLKEGAAVEDFMKPDRVVAGTRREEVLEVLWDLYQPYLRTDKPILSMSPESAEMTKYAANAMLATKISFINEIAAICERTGADINDVRRGIGHDSRIGFAFLFPGVGYGGSCFPTDVRALAAVAKAHDVTPRILEATHGVNEHQKGILLRKIREHFGGALSDKTIAIWGLAFKPGTDDIREAPSLVLIDGLLKHGATLRVYDPEAMDNVRRIYASRLFYSPQRDETLDGADALAILTEWRQFVHPDFEEMKRRLRRPVVFDGRNIYNPYRMRDLGFTYYSIGRPPVRP
ncbi:MAG: UDP-glucose dehydrogenase family protein [Thermogutta sp.]